MSARSGAPRPLSRLLAALDDPVRPRGIGDPIVRGISHDTRTLAAGDLYVALPGARSDGARFIAEAVARGAAAVLTDGADPAGPIAGVPVVVVADVRRALSRVASVWFAEPSRALTVLGVTGTNGKTTTSELLRAIFDAAGRPCARIGTLGVAYGGRERPLANTTPLALELQGLLAEARDARMEAVAMEVSSHALAQSRVADVRFACAVFTNLTRDHLDYHETTEAYAAAKRRLFDLAPIAVLDVDDAYGRRWADELRAAGRRVLTCALDREADVRAEELRLAADGSTFVANGTVVRLALPGRFNVRNALAALAAAQACGIAPAVAVAGLAAVHGVPGRMEAFAADGVGVFVDYAHTPDALANVLRAVRELTAGAVVVVFGCGGDRDAGKRPQMGAIASRLADRVVVTSDNSRGEDPGAIAHEILAGVARGTVAILELDRRAAIRDAIAGARPGDAVVVAGKGHEATQSARGVETPFDDRVEVRAALAARAGATA